MGKYSDYMLIYTDGAKEPETGVAGFGVAVPAKGTEINGGTSNMLGGHTVEMLAVLVALRQVEESRHNQILICSDFSSVLASLKSFQSNSRQDILYEVHQSVTRLVNRGGQIRFMWVPAHVGTRGNKRADELAKRALRKGRTEMEVSISKAEDH